MSPAVKFLGMKLQVECLIALVEGATLEIGFFAARWNKKISARRRWKKHSDSQNRGLTPQKIKTSPLFLCFVRY